MLVLTLRKHYRHTFRKGVFRERSLCRNVYIIQICDKNKKVSVGKVRWVSSQPLCQAVLQWAWARQKNMRSLLIFRNGEWLRNSTLNWRFPISENVGQIHSSPSVKLRKNTKFIASYPAPGKYQWIACSPERFSIVFPCARTRHFPSVFPRNN